MNAHCIKCRHLRMVAVLRGYDWSPFFACAATSERATHLKHEAEALECMEEKAVPVMDEALEIAHKKNVHALLHDNEN